MLPAAAAAAMAAVMLLATAAEKAKTAPVVLFKVSMGQQPQPPLERVLGPAQQPVEALSSANQRT